MHAKSIARDYNTGFADLSRRRKPLLQIVQRHRPPACNCSSADDSRTSHLQSTTSSQAQIKCSLYPPCFPTTIIINTTNVVAERTRTFLSLSLCLSVSRFSCTAYCKTHSIRSSTPSDPAPSPPSVESFGPQGKRGRFGRLRKCAVPRRCILCPFDLFEGVFFYVMNKKRNESLPYLFVR